MKARMKRSPFRCRAKQHSCYAADGAAAGNKEVTRRLARRHKYSAARLPKGVDYSRPADAGCEQRAGREDIRAGAKAPSRQIAGLMARTISCIFLEKCVGLWL